MHFGIWCEPVFGLGLRAGRLSVSGFAFAGNSEELGKAGSLWTSRKPRCATQQHAYL